MHVLDQEQIQCNTTPPSTDHQVKEKVVGQCPSNPCTSPRQRTCHNSWRASRLQAHDQIGRRAKGGGEENRKKNGDTRTTYALGQMSSSRRRRSVGPYTISTHSSTDPIKLLCQSARNTIEKDSLERGKGSSLDLFFNSYLVLVNSGVIPSVSLFMNLFTYKLRWRMCFTLFYFTWWRRSW